MSSNDEQDPKIEALLETLADGAEFRPGEGAVDSVAEIGLVSDATLEAYRRGELDEAEASALERRLAGDARARQRLAELGGFESELPSELKERIRSSLEAPGSRRWMGLAAALVGAILGAFLLFQPAPPAFDGPLPPYQVDVTGLATDRGGQDGVTRTVVEPSTRLRIVARPLAGGTPASIFELFRQVEGRWQPLQDPMIAVDVRRSTVSWSGPAERFVGSEPGLHALVVVVSPALHALHEPSYEESAMVALEKDARYRVQRVQIELRAPSGDP